MARESYVKKAWQYNPETGASGWFPVLDPITGDPVIVTGEVQVDYVWGNLPLQPNDDRGYAETNFGGGSGDAYWAPTTYFKSGTLQTEDYSVTIGNTFGGFEVKVPADNHIIATTGYSNFPGYIPNYAGDGDPGFETVVPNVVGMAVPEYAPALTAANLSWNTYTVNPGVTHGKTTTSTVTLTVDDVLNLRAGDTVYIDQFIVAPGPGETPIALGYQQLTAVDKVANTISFANTDLSFDAVCSGAVWGSNTTTRRVISQDPAAGDIIDEGATVTLTVLYVD